MNENTLVLPSGAVVTTRRNEDVSERLRRPIEHSMALLSPQGREAIKAGQELAKFRAGKIELNAESIAALEAEVRYSREDVAVLSEANDYGILALVAHWSSDPAPKTPDDLLNIPSRDYDVLREAAGAFVVTLMTDFSPSPDAASPTSPSSDSAVRSEEMTPADHSPQNGEPIASSV